MMTINEYPRIWFRASNAHTHGIDLMVDALHALQAIQSIEHPVVIVGEGLTTHAPRSSVAGPDPVPCNRMAAACAQS